MRTHGSCGADPTRKPTSPPSEEESGLANCYAIPDAGRELRTMCATVVLLSFVTG